MKPVKRHATIPQNCKTKQNEHEEEEDDEQ
jgi:hypothetical protein